MKRISVLGSTGSIGTNTLKIAERFPDRFRIVSLAAGKNIELLSEQIRRFSPKVAVVIDAEHAEELKKSLPGSSNVKVLFGRDGYLEAASLEESDILVTAVVGAAGLLPTLAAIEAGKDIALANKETLVMAGELVMKKAREANVAILPVDSEHSAIFQCLTGQRKEDFQRILLTASGGPFFSLPKDRFEKIELRDALNHPTWRMGRKITIDSATLMNKGLEVIEAKWLFDVEPDGIQVVVHPQSIVHSMVAYRDGSVIAQLSVPDMRGAIAYALSYPERLDIGLTVPDFPSLGTLSFAEPDLEKFPCLALAMKACRVGGTLPAVLNAANEIAVEHFLQEKIRFLDIPRIIEKVCADHQTVSSPGLDEILASDRWARQAAQKEAARRNAER